MDRIGFTAFIPAREKSGPGCLDKDGEEERQKDKLSGKEAKDFYESILNEPSTSVKEEPLEQVGPSRPIRRSHRRQQYPELDSSDCHAYLKAAQTGDQKTLEEYLSNGMPIDIMDSFYWTALMIAAAADQEGICKLLISRGANYNLVNSKDQSIFDILDETKNEPLAERLIEFIGQHEAPEESYIELEEDIFCSVCQCRFSRETDHETTTVHIYNAGKRGTTHSGILIPESNIGYKLLKKQGWTEEFGLGKEGEGRKFPVRTILKRNRKGLGLEKMKPKVTHFRANDESAVQAERNVQPSKSSWKKEMKRKEAKEQRIAKNFRNAFSLDDSVAKYLGM